MESPYAYSRNRQRWSAHRAHIASNRERFSLASRQAAESKQTSPLSEDLDMATSPKGIFSWLTGLVVELFIISLFVAAAKYGPDALHAATHAVKDLHSADHSTSWIR